MSKFINVSESVDETSDVPVAPLSQYSNRVLDVPSLNTHDYVFFKDANSPTAEKLKVMRSGSTTAMPTSPKGTTPKGKKSPKKSPKMSPMAVSTPPLSPKHPWKTQISILSNLASRLELENYQRSIDIMESDNGSIQVKEAIKSAVKRIYETDTCIPISQPLKKYDESTEQVLRKAESADASLKTLKEGNASFLEKVNEGSGEAPTQFNSMLALTGGQKPFSILVSCSDSRVPPELVFDQGLGDLFVIRLAGNTLDSHARASILYAIHHLSCPLVVVMGHESCGAVKAAFLPNEVLEKEPEDVQNLVEGIRQGMTDVLDEDASPAEKCICAVICNVHHQVRTLKEHPDFKALVSEEKIKICGAYYGFNGAVTFFDEDKD